MSEMAVIYSGEVGPFRYSIVNVIDFDSIIYRIE